MLIYQRVDVLRYGICLDELRYTYIDIMLRDTRISIGS